MLPYPDNLDPDIEASGHDSITGHEISGFLMSWDRVLLENLSPVFGVPLYLLCIAIDISVKIAYCNYFV